MTNRRWTATIVQGNGEVEADLSEADLKADQMKLAIREAVGYLNNGEHCEVVILKTTKAHGTVVDTSRTVSLVDGKVWVQ